MRGFAIDAESADAGFQAVEQQAQELGEAVREAQARLAGIRQAATGNQQQLEQVAQDLSAARARHASIEEILRERAYTADAVQKLFSAQRGERSSARLPCGRAARGLCRSAGRI